MVDKLTNDYWNAVDHFQQTREGKGKEAHDIRSRARFEPEMPLSDYQLVWLTVKAKRGAARQPPALPQLPLSCRPCAARHPAVPRAAEVLFINFDDQFEASEDTHNRRWNNGTLLVGTAFLLFLGCWLLLQPVVQRDYALYELALDQFYRMQCQLVNLYIKCEIISRQPSVITLRPARRRRTGCIDTDETCW